MPGQGTPLMISIKKSDDRRMSFVRQFPALIMFQLSKAQKQYQYAKIATFVFRQLELTHSLITIRK